MGRGAQDCIMFILTDWSYSLTSSNLSDTALFFYVTECGFAEFVPLHNELSCSFFCFCFLLWSKCRGNMSFELSRESFGLQQEHVA